MEKLTEEQLEIIYKCSIPGARYEGVPVLDSLTYSDACLRALSIHKEYDKSRGQDFIKFFSSRLKKRILDERRNRTKTRCKANKPTFVQLNDVLISSPTISSEEPDKLFDICLTFLNKQQYKQLFILRYVNRLKLDECAEIMNISISRVNEAIRIISDTLLKHKDEILKSAGYV